MPRLRPGVLVLATTLFAAAAAGGTGALLLRRQRSAALAAVADRQALLVSLQARLIDVEVTRLLAEMTRLSGLAEVDLADGDLEPEKRVLRVAQRDTALFAVAIAILDERGSVLWSEPQGVALGADGAALVGAARGLGRAVLQVFDGGLDVAAPIAGRGAIVGQVSARQRDLFGEALGRAARAGGGVALLRVAPGGAAFPVAVAGAAPAAGLSADAGQAWRTDAAGRRWLVTEARVGDGPLLLRLAQPAAGLEDEAGRPLRGLVTLVAAALLLAALGGALLSRAVVRLDRAEAELRRSRDLAAMGRTAAAIAHEVKNSLNGLSIAVDLLAAGRAPAAARDEVHRQARAEIGRLRDVAEDLTLFAAPPRLDRAEVDLAELCRAAAAACADLARDCGAELELALPPDGARVAVHGDGRKLAGALQNLVRNALEAVGPGGFGEPLGEAPPARAQRVRVEASVRGAWGVAEVSDRGPGLAAEVRARLFEPFVSTKRNGTGLGLAIARRVAEAHGGSLDARDRDGGGTIFRLALPLAPPGREAADAGADAGAAADRGGAP